MAATQRIWSAKLNGAKVLLVIPSFQIGGSERQAAALARWFGRSLGRLVPEGDGYKIGFSFGPNRSE